MNVEKNNEEISANCKIVQQKTNFPIEMKN